MNSHPWIAIFVGAHGFGKSTQTQLLATALRTPVLKKTVWAQQAGLPRNPTTALHYYELLSSTEAFLRQAIHPALQEYKLAILDGFPRHIQEFHALHRYTCEHEIPTIVFHFHLPDPEQTRTLSLHRQRQRDAAADKKIDEARYQQKVALTESQLSFINLLSDTHWQYVVLDPLQPCDVLHQQIRKELGLDFDTLSFNRRVLGILHSLDPEAYMLSGHFFRPFFNGLFGPPQEPTHAVVGVIGEQRRQSLENRLVAVAPEYRWRVRDVAAITFQRLGVHIQCLQEGLQRSHQLIGLSGGVRLDSNGTIDLCCPPDAEAHLRRGMLAPALQCNIDRATDMARELIQQYPALSASFLGYSGAPVMPHWQQIELECRKIERGGHRCWTGLSDRERQTAHQLMEFARTASTRPEPPPVPPRAPLPEGFAWDAPDASFREWLIAGSQGGEPHSDPLIALASAYQSGVPQKPTHQGWMTHQHMFWALMGLETDGFPAWRRAARVAILFHDLGKAQDILSPGAHGMISARAWLFYAPDWLSPAEREVTTFLIRNHDLLGRVALAVKWPAYLGAVDPAYVRSCLNQLDIHPRELLRMLLAVNRADVGAVATLRWTLPELDLAAEMIGV